MEVETINSTQQSYQEPSVNSSPQTKDYSLDMQETMPPRDPDITIDIIA
jgi:hypothetical protein